MNIRILVCHTCLDTPQENLRTIVLPADPLPVIQPRVESFDTAETDYHAASGPPEIDFWTGLPKPGTTTFVTQDGQNLSQQPIGIPSNLDIDAVMPQFGRQAYAVSLNPLSIIANGSDTITVTCPKAHGLATNAEIVVQGLSNTRACGAYSITVTTATAFTYQVVPAIAAGSLLTSETRMLTANIGIPRGFTQIPQTGEWFREAGAPVPTPAPPPVTTLSFFLLETSGFLLLEDGVSKLALEA